MHAIDLIVWFHDSSMWPELAARIAKRDDRIGDLGACYPHGQPQQSKRLSIMLPGRAGRENSRAHAEAHYYSTPLLARPCLHWDFRLEAARARS